MKTFNKNKYRVLSTVSKYAFVFILAFAIIFPIAVVRAQCPGDPNCPAEFDKTNNNPAEFDKTANNNTKTSESGVKIDTGIKNPLGDNIQDIPTFIKTILNIVLLIGVPIIALAIIYSGFLFVAARGNAEELKKAKSTLVYTLIGAALLLGCLVIANAIKGTVDTITNDQPQ